MWTREPDKRPGLARPRPRSWPGAPRLRRAGFDTALAEQLSREFDTDLHALIELVERGCPAPLAARILAPLDHKRRAC